MRDLRSIKEANDDAVAAYNAKRKRIIESNPQKIREQALADDEYKHRVKILRRLNGKGIPS